MLNEGFISRSIQQYRMPTETVAQTVVLDLETSNRKNNKIQKCINQYQEMSKDEPLWG